VGDLAGNGAVRPPKRAAPVATEVVDLYSDIRDALCEQLHFRALPKGWKYAPSLDRVMLPVHSPKYERRGWVARSYSGATPKVLSYKEVLDQPYLHWAIGEVERERVYIVEDIPSADRIAEAGQNACALMGTHCANDCLDEIVDQGYREVVIALDKDAMKQAFKVHNALCLRVRTIRTRVLEKDVKNMTQQELDDWLNVDY
jgi:DNA primase